MGLGQRLTHSTHSVREATSHSQNPAISSLVSAKGPSVVDARLDRSVQPATWIEGSGDTRLAQQRAAAVADVARGAGARVAREIGYGERRPVASNATAAGLRENRRVEIVCYR